VTNATVTGVDGRGVTVEIAGEGGRVVPSRTVIWAAGVQASPLARRLSELTGAEIDRAGRVTVEPDLTLPGRPEVFALGDMVRPAGRSLPGVAPVAMQQGRYVARVVRARLRSQTVARFRYRDKGNLATIGRGAAVAEIGRLKLSGAVAWLTWLMVHIWYLVGFQNRLLVFIRWSFNFVTHGRGARLITAEASMAEQESGS
jgi:NADH:ubiquinone reductase (H+-translocating)